MFTLDDTIAALASAAGGAGRGIIRCSGPKVLEILSARFFPHDLESWVSGKRARRHPGEWELGVRSSGSADPAHSGNAHTGKDGSGNVAIQQTVRLPVDVYFWPNRRSYTGQSQAEIHTIGSPPLLEVLLGNLFDAGARPAEPGEFTLRAFLAGRMDLLQAEAVLGVIDAADPRALQLALTQLAGGVSSRLTELRFELVDLLADLEAGLDFTEEGIEFVSRSFLTERITAARDELQRLWVRASSHGRHTAMPRVVLAGVPNAGKSTLFNALVGQHKALVSPIPGTTRDYLTAAVDWMGTSWELVDTAGWEPSEDPILNVALHLRRTQMEQADVILQCTPIETWLAQSESGGSRPRSDNLNSGTKYDAKGNWQVGELSDSSDTVAGKVIHVVTKSDLLSTKSRPPDPGTVLVSAATGAGLEALKTEITQALALRGGSDAGILGSTLSRCHDSLQGAISALERAAELAVSGGGDEFLATDVREALDELGRITGAFYTDDLLDRIFSKFCIGK